MDKEEKLDTFEWACDEAYQNSEEELNIMIGSIPIQQEIKIYR